jgi:hypothetical protein
MYQLAPRVHAGHGIAICMLPIIKLRAMLSQLATPLQDHVAILRKALP